MGIERTNRLTPPTGDVQVSNNVTTVTGLFGVPFNTATPSAGSIPLFDQNGLQVNFATVLPLSFIPTIPASQISGVPTFSQVAARIHARM